MPKVINLKATYGVVPEGAVRIDRKTEFGNPHQIRRSVTREDALARYRADLASGRIKPDLEKLRGKDLCCWCAPLACHGDILLEMANK